MTEFNFKFISQAIKNKQVPDALRLIDLKKEWKHAGFNQGYENAKKALEHACAKNQTKTVQLLLKLKIVQNAAAAEDNQALISACFYGYTGVVQLLLSLENVREAATAQGNKALISACLYGHTETVQLLLSLKNIRESATAQDNKALISACYHGHTEVVQLLLSLKNVREAATAQGNKALINACSRGRTEVVQHLLSLENVREAAAARGNQALREACQKGMVLVAHNLLTIEGVRVATVNDDSILRLVCKQGMNGLIETMLNLPNLSLDLVALKQDWSAEELTTLRLHLALFLLNRPGHVLAERLSPAQQKDLQFELCQTYFELCQQLKSLQLPSNFPEDLENEILSYLHPIAKQKKGNNIPLLKNLTRASIEHQSLTVLQALSDKGDLDSLGRLLKQRVMQSEIYRCLRQALEQGDNKKVAAYLDTPLLILPLNWVSLAKPLNLALTPQAIHCPSLT